MDNINFIEESVRMNNVKVLGIDVKKKGSKDFVGNEKVLGIASRDDDVVTVLKFAKDEMLNRVAKAQELGLNSIMDANPKVVSRLIVAINDDPNYLNYLDPQITSLISDLEKYGKDAGVEVVKR